MSRSYNSLHPDDMDLKAAGGDTGWQSARYQKSVSAEESMHGLDASDFIAGFQHPALLSLVFLDPAADDPASDSRVDDEEQTDVQPQSVRTRGLRPARIVQARYLPRTFHLMIEWLSRSRLRLVLLDS